MFDMHRLRDRREREALERLRAGVEPARWGDCPSCGQLATWCRHGACLECRSATARTFAQHH